MLNEVYCLISKSILSNFIESRFLAFQEDILIGFHMGEDLGLLDLGLWRNPNVLNQDIQDRTVSGSLLFVKSEETEV